jgi:hypothetical protein
MENAGIKDPGAQHIQTGNGPALSPFHRLPFAWIEVLPRIYQCHGFAHQSDPTQSAVSSEDDL